MYTHSAVAVSLAAWCAQRWTSFISLPCSSVLWYSFSCFQY